MSTKSTRRLAAIVCGLTLLLLVWAGLPGGAVAQVRVTPKTEVRSIRFEGAHSLRETVLREVLRTKSRGAAYGLRRTLGKLPLIDSPERHSFSPRVLQEDVVRLRNLYFQSGFLATDIRYTVDQDLEEDVIDITFIVKEGAPITIGGVRVLAADTTQSLSVPPEESKSWEKIMKELNDVVGNRLDIDEVRRDRDLIQDWWQDHGFPQAEVGGYLDRDSLSTEGSILYLVGAGPRKRFGDIVVEGNQTLSNGTVRHQLPFKPGQYYSKSALDKGRRDLQQLPVVRNVHMDTADPNQEGSVDPSSPMDVVVRVNEAKPRVIRGKLGYGLDTGIWVEPSWAHRNFTGGGRVFTVSALAQTGELATIEDPDQRYRGAVSLQQPNFLNPRLSAVVSPFVEYREDIHDRSLQVGSNFTLVYELERQASVSLDYQIASKEIYEYRLGDLGTGGIDFLTLLKEIAEGQADSLGSTLGSSLFTLSGLTGNLDNLTHPRSGLLLHPTLQVTAPTAWSETAYWRADASLFAFTPVGKRFTLAARVTGGRLFPFGKSIPAEPEDRLEKSFQLRDATFTAGGSSDVRGWGQRRLGPKFPDLRFREEGDSLAAYSEGYVPLGGLSRISFSLELRMPMPLLGPSFGSHVFFDGGRVWTDDSRFSSGEDLLDQQIFFYAAGAGLDIHTPVGDIKLSLGCKLNPSIPDLVDSEDLLRALLADESLDDLKRHEWRRLQVNFAFGTSY